MGLSNVSIPALKSPTFKVANFRAPAVKIAVPKINTNISAKPARPSKIKIS